MKLESQYGRGIADGGGRLVLECNCDSVGATVKRILANWRGVAAD